LLQQTGLSRISYVLAPQYYAQNISKANKKFFNELNKMKKSGRNKYSSDYLLKGDSLVIKKDWDKPYSVFFKNIQSILVAHSK
jgi:hypothetical protein